MDEGIRVKLFVSDVSLATAGQEEEQVLVVMRTANERPGRLEVWMSRAEQQWCYPLGSYVEFVLPNSRTPEEPVQPALEGVEYAAN